MDLKLNADRFTGDEYVALYNKYRPIPPADLFVQCLNYLGKTKANLVADLGCGTGISTRAISAYCKTVVGVEPSAEMLAVAKASGQQSNISYVPGFAHETDFATHSVDIVTCSQSFHWMEPESTLKEIDRILKDAGVLMIYDVIWPPSTSVTLEQAFHQLFEQVDKLTLQLGEQIAVRWDKTKHLENVKVGNYFDLVKEAYYHKSEVYDPEKFIGIALSQGGIEALLKRGYSEQEIGITRFREIVSSADTPKPDLLTFNYRVVFGIRTK